MFAPRDKPICQHCRNTRENGAAVNRPLFVEHMHVSDVALHAVIECC